MVKNIARGLWSAGVLAGLAAGVLAAAPTPGVAQPRNDSLCYRCECSERRCVCLEVACPEGDP